MLNRRCFIKSAVKSIGCFTSISILSHLDCSSNSTEMPKRILGRTKLSVSLLGFGCTQVKNKAAYKRAVELGINYFHMGDRDPTYNLDACEALFPFRNSINIAYMSHPKASKTLLLEDLDNFLQQSGFGYLDVWFVITPGPGVLKEFSEAVHTARKDGKVRWAGITTHSLDRDVVTLTNSDSIVDVVMMAYNYLSPQKHSEILNMFHDAELGITPMKPLAGKFYEATGQKPDALLRWLAADERIHTIPVIMTTTEQVEGNTAAIKFSLSEADRQKLQALYPFNSPRFCRMCGACDGKCPKGLAISDLVRTAMYVDGYKDIYLARSNFLLIPEKNRRIYCDQCEHCTVVCPNDIAIQERICSVRRWLV